MTAPPDATLGAIPLEHAALCVDCDAIIDVRVMRDTGRVTCRSHTWVRLSRWLPPMPPEEEAKP
jgi:hypothetical protein